MFEKHCLNRDRKLPNRRLPPNKPSRFGLGFGQSYGGNFPCIVLNVRKHLQSFNSFMVNVLIWQFHNSNCSYSLITVIFYKSNCKHLYLQMRLWKATFSKELLFRSTYSLNFLSNYCSFWEQLLLRRSIWNIKFL